MKWLLSIAFIAVGLQAAPVGSGYLVRLVDGLVFIKDASDNLTTFEADLGDVFPSASSCFVREGSKLELVGPGKTIRFGEDTNFTLRSHEVMEIHKGAVLIYSRRQDTKIQLEGPAATVVISGTGAVMVEVNTNGGFKMVALVGPIRIEETGQDASSSPLSLDSGELVFLKPLGNGFGDKLNVRLRRICETAHLVSGYGNPTLLRNQLRVAINVQDRHIEGSFGIKVGDASEIERFETTPIAKP
jgi:hypothetical protein